MNAPRFIWLSATLLALWGGSSALAAEGITNGTRQAIQDFKRLCITHSPSIPAVYKAGKAAGFDIKNRGPQAFIAWRNLPDGSLEGLQMNMLTRYDYECAITIIGPSAMTRSIVRDAFFKTLRLTNDNGARQVKIRGRSFTVRHDSYLSGNGVGHEFLLQQ